MVIHGFIMMNPEPKITFDYDLPKEFQEIIDNINKQTANDIFEE
jgi:hypothetical protein